MNSSATSDPNPAAPASGSTLQQTLAAFLPSQRWYAAKSERLVGVSVAEQATLAAGDGAVGATLLLVDATTDSGRKDRYFLPLLHGPDGRGGDDGSATVDDAMVDEAFCRRLLSMIAAGDTCEGHAGVFEFHASKGLGSARNDGRERASGLDAASGNTDADAEGFRALGSSSNSVALLGRRWFLKVFRRVQPGENPDLEIGRYLTQVRSAFSVPVLGHIDYRSRQGDVSTVALLQPQVEIVGDAWEYALDRLRAVLRSDGQGDEGTNDAAGELDRRIAQIGRSLAGVHGLFAQAGQGNPSFAPEPITEQDRERWVQAIRTERRETFEQLRQARGADTLGDLLASVLDAGDPLDQHVAELAREAAPDLKTRVHGDFHLGQVLVTAEGVRITDFEGEPHRPVQERRAKHSAWRDVAGLLRSLDYLRCAAIAGLDDPLAAGRGAQWLASARRIALASYCRTAIRRGLYPSVSSFRAALPWARLFEIEKVLYEIRYELAQRPDWVRVPLSALADYIPANPPNARASQPSNRNRPSTAATQMHSEPS